MRPAQIANGDGIHTTYAYLGTWNLIRILVAAMSATTFPAFGSVSQC